MRDRENRTDYLGGIDSTSGKIMEKMGGMFGNKQMEEKGAAKREKAGYGDDSGSGNYGGSNNDNY